VFCDVDVTPRLMMDGFLPSKGIDSMDDIIVNRNSFMQEAPTSYMLGTGHYLQEGTSAFGNRVIKKNKFP
jgi:hypothetical protein